METQLLLDVMHLTSEVSSFEGVIDDAILELNDPYRRPFGGIRYHLKAQLLGTELLVKGTLEQDFEGVCSRCGRDFTFTARTTDFLVNEPITDKTESVDLTDELRQCIILALPTYPVCRSDCRGVCAHCGKNLNEGPCSCVDEMRDDRWGVLDALQPGKQN